MRRFVVSQFRFRRSRTGALAVGILVASVSFTLLTASAKTSSLHVQGTLTSSFQPAYDILVRPIGTQTRLERSERLVRPNFLSGIYGGITLKQWHAIERINGVAVAAPVANVGYVLPFSNLPVSLSRVVTTKPFQLYRIHQAWTTDRGLTRYQGPDLYVYYTPGDVFRSPKDPYKPYVETGPNVSTPVPSCYGFYVGQPSQPTSPFPPLESQSTLACFPAKLNGSATPGVGVGGLPPSRTFVGTATTGYFPIYISAIDPEQEAKLVGLDRTVVHGRYLRPDEGLSPYTPSGGNISYEVVPILASTRTYVDESLDLTIERLHVPANTDVPRLLATNPLLPPTKGSRYPTARAFLTSLGGRMVAHESVSSASVYRRLLRTAPSAGWQPGMFTPDAYWTTSPVQYAKHGKNALTPQSVRNRDTVWNSKFSNFYTPPYDNLDTQFRLLHERISTNLINGNRAEWNPLQIVGEFDPEKLPTFSPLSKVPLETYAPPELSPADRRSEQLLRGSLLPNQNLGGYIQQPPLFLTTMQGLESFLTTRIWQTVDGKNAIPLAQRLAPISAIRVRVAGVTGPDPLSLERVRLAAQRIHDSTGLAVDITAGSSPHPIPISLPKGRFGRPALLLNEGWSKKGVTVSFLRALDRKDLALFALILVICAFFLGNGVLASVRSRRTEIGTLLTLGWSPIAIFAATLSELALIGVVVGALGTGLAALLATTLTLHISLLSTLLVLPVAVALALVAGLVPAWVAASGTPLDALRPATTARRRRWRIRRHATFALANLTRVPTRTTLGASGLALGVAALSILLAIERAFQGTLVGTVLGSAVSVQVRNADFAAVGLTIALAALSVSDVLYINLRERAAEIITLKTIGWAPSDIAATVLLEGLGLGIIGSLAGALLGFAVGAGVLAVPAAPLALTCAISAIGGVIAALIASVLPLSQLGRLATPTVLAAE